MENSDVIILPPDYSEIDQEYRQELLRQLQELDSEYQRRREQLIDALCDIENRYQPRIILTPRRAGNGE